MVHLGIILVLFLFSFNNGINGKKLPDHFPQIIERLHDLEKRLHVQEQKNVHLEKRLSDQEKLNAIQTELIQELTSWDCKFKEKKTVLSNDDRYLFSKGLI